LNPDTPEPHSVGPLFLNPKKIQPAGFDMTKGDLRRILNDVITHISDDVVIYFNDTKTDTLFEVNVLVVADDGEKIIMEAEDVY
jgi:hypothetical protein